MVPPRCGGLRDAGGGADEALPVVALEQIRRWRAIRERGAAERRIRDLERYNENVIQNMNSAVLVFDPEGRVTSCNRAGRADPRAAGRRADRPSRWATGSRMAPARAWLPGRSPRESASRAPRA